MKRLILTLFGAGLLCLSFPVSAVESRGARSCAGWQEGRLAEKEGYSRAAEIDQTWLVGYLSGLVAGAGLDFLAGTDNATLFALADAYCAATPAGNLATAGVAVARQLMQQKGLVYRGTMP